MSYSIYLDKKCRMLFNTVINVASENCTHFLANSPENIPHHILLLKTITSHSNKAMQLLPKHRVGGEGGVHTLRDVGSIEKWGGGGHTFTHSGR